MSSSSEFLLSSTKRAEQEKKENDKSNFVGSFVYIKKPKPNSSTPEHFNNKKLFFAIFICHKRTYSPYRVIAYQLCWVLCVLQL